MSKLVILVVTDRLALQDLAKLKSLLSAARTAGLSTRLLEMSPTPETEIIFQPEEIGSKDKSEWLSENKVTHAILVGRRAFNKVHPQLPGITYINIPGPAMWEETDQKAAAIDQVRRMIQVYKDRESALVLCASKASSPQASGIPSIPDSLASGDSKHERATRATALQAEPKDGSTSTASAIELSEQGTLENKEAGTPNLEKPVCSQDSTSPEGSGREHGQRGLETTKSLQESDFTVSPQPLPRSPIPCLAEPSGEGSMLETDTATEFSARHVASDAVISLPHQGPRPEQIGLPASSDHDAVIRSKTDSVAACTTPLLPGTPLAEQTGSIPGNAASAIRSKTEDLVPHIPGSSRPGPTSVAGSPNLDSPEVAHGDVSTTERIISCARTDLGMQPALPAAFPTASTATVLSHARTDSPVRDKNPLDTDTEPRIPTGLVDLTEPTTTHAGGLTTPGRSPVDLTAPPKTSDDLEEPALSDSVLKHGMRVKPLGDAGPSEEGTELISELALGKFESFLELAVSSSGLQAVMFEWTDKGPVIQLVRAGTKQNIKIGSVVPILVDSGVFGDETKLKKIKDSLMAAGFEKPYLLTVREFILFVRLFLQISKQCQAVISITE